MQICRLGIDVQQSGHDLAQGVVLVDVVQRPITIRRIVVLMQFAQAQNRSIVLLDFDHLAGRIGRGDLLVRRNEIDPAHRLVVFAHVVVALGAALVVVEGHARADHVDKRRAAVGHGTLDQRHQLRLVAGETACDVCCTQLQGERDEVDRAVMVDDALLAFRTLVGGG